MRHKVILSVVLAGLLAAPGMRAWADDVEAGIALYREGKYAEAEARLKDATGTEARAYLAGSLARQKKYAEAQAQALAVLTDSPTHEVAVAALGEALVGQKKYDDAIERLTAALAKKDDLAYAYFWRGQAYDKKNQAARMVADYQAFLKLAPKAPEAPAVQAVLAALR
ncbi:MAG: tetratricopeptide repeat protein [Vicinamibacteria bacterium]|nr:tetratricopeptide repeat protein [Vicinamibacteria bacterium]